jgi:serine/threonine-protein kinase
VSESDTPLALSAAALGERYRLGRELGAGGMATVYLAHDLRHDRDVAIKILHRHLGTSLGAERFLREIRTTARLQHPHVLPLLDSGDAGEGLLWYAMPYVRGETLRTRLERERQLPVDEAVRLAREVAAALEHAHRQGVVHRDIKPENILLQDGSVLVADFGIALAVEQAGGARMTQTGVSLGTPQYMSPEQATGERTIDARTDVYALGATTYEMLVGEPPFTGPTMQAVMARIVAEAPRGLAGQRRTIPPHVEAAVLRALEKLPADRFASAAEFASALVAPTVARVDAASSGAAAVAVPRRRAARGARAAAATALLGAVAAGGWFLGRGDGGAPRDGGTPIEFAFEPGNLATQRPYVAISHDGRTVVVPIVDASGARRLALRHLDSAGVVIVPRTERANAAVFSPDDRTLAVLVAGGRIALVPLDGGVATTLDAGATILGLAWAPDGWIYFSRIDGRTHALFRIRASGGAAARVTRPDVSNREFAHWYPAVVGDGRAILFGTYTTPVERSRIEAVEPATGRRTTVVDNAMSPRLSGGHLLFVRGGVLHAAPFDETRLALTGDPRPVLDDVAALPSQGLSGYAVSETGVLVHIPASRFFPSSRVVWIARDGAETPVASVEDVWSEPRLSPDGRTIALVRSLASPELWLLDVARGVPSRLSPSGRVALAPLWSADGRSLLYTTESPTFDLARIAVDGGVGHTVLASDFDKFAVAGSPDGRWLAFVEARDRNRLMLMPLGGGPAQRLDGRPAITDVTQYNADFSPDGGWIAYDEVAPDRPSEVYVRRWPGDGGRRQVSAAGGSEPRFSKGGREIVFRRGTALLAASFDPVTGVVGRPTVVLQRRVAWSAGNWRTRSYDVAPDGSRFLLTVPVERTGEPPVVVRTGWSPAAAAPPR